jgi:protein tyrosine phosphatase (PTP) superfamily phosphohydrolase (DUF442 family)
VKIVVQGGIAIFIIMAIVGFFHGLRVSSDGIRLSKNFYAVDPGKFYRSAQLTGDELDEVIRRFGIKTVINLRGDNPGASWFDNEVRVVNKERVKFISLPMATDSIPHTDELEALLDAYSKSPRPILIHCQSGSDRTGEASAIYAMEYMHMPREQALGMLSPRYWHFSILVPSKTYFMSLYQGAEWAREKYDDCDKRYLWADRRECWRHWYVSGFLSDPLTDPQLEYEFKFDRSLRQWPTSAVQSSTAIEQTSNLK